MDTTTTIQLFVCPAIILARPASMPYHVRPAIWPSVTDNKTALPYSVTASISTMTQVSLSASLAIIAV